MATYTASSADVRASVRQYVAGFAALLVLTALTVGASTQLTATGSRATVALGIAGVEAIVALTIFMKLPRARWVILGSLLLTLVLLIATLALPVLSEGDHIVGTRHRTWDAGVAAPGAARHEEGH